MLGFVALIVVAAVVLGGGSDAPTTGAPFDRQAQRICAQARAEVAGLVAPKTLRELARTAQQAAQITSETRSALAKLTPPQQARADMDALLSSLQRQQRLTTRVASAAAAGSAVRVRLLVKEGAREDLRTGRAAQRVGLAACVMR